MTGNHDERAGGNGAAMFAGLPRRRWLGWVALTAWFGLLAAFVGDLVPTASPGDWLYGVEARRDANARVLARAGAAPAPHRPSPAVLASRAER
jgi:hypothetical protein